MLKKDLIDKFKLSLKKELKEIKILSEKTELNRAPVILDQQSVGRFSRMDAIQQQNMNIASETNRKKRIIHIEATLKRIHENDFGFCISCGLEISVKRLEIDPTVLKCIECA